MMKSLTKFGRMILVAMITSFIGMVFYIITSTTGYLAGSGLKILPIILTVIAILLAFVLIKESKLHPLLIDLFIVVSTVLLIVSFAYFTHGRISLAADVYFIPVNYPKAEEFALNLSIVGLICYMISIVSMIIVAFSDKIRN